MKRLLCLLLALLLLTGCGIATVGQSDAGVLFYYRGSSGDYLSELGAMGAERRALHEDQQNVAGLMELYLGGPMTPELFSPFPNGMRLLRSEVSGQELTLIFDDSLAALSGVGLHLACACIARTLGEYAGYETVTFRAETQSLDGEAQYTVRPADLVLEDHSAGQPNALVRLYFSDAQSRYLIEEQRSASIEDSTSLPDYILHSLIGGPQSESLRPTIPDGTMLLNVSVVERVCIVNFSAEFLQNRPRNGLEERMTVFSVVNSLTQLEEVDSVEILVEGSSVERYFELNLSRELVRDEAVIGPVRSGVGEFDATLYLCLEGVDALTAFPVHPLASVDRIQAATVLSELCSFSPRNGYYSPAADLITLQSVRQEGQTLRIEYLGNPNETQRTMLLRSLLATAHALPDVSEVELIENGSALDLGEARRKDGADWFRSS